MTVSIRRLTAVLGLFLAGAVAERLGSRTILIAGSVLQVATTLHTLQCSDGAKTTSPQILAACSIHFCSSFPGLTVTVGMFSLTCLLVMVPSYSLLSEICLIRYR